MIFLILMVGLAFWQVWTGVGLLQGKRISPAIRRTFSSDAQLAKWCKKQGLSRILLGLALTMTLLFPLMPAVGLALCGLCVIGSVVAMVWPVK